MGTLILLILAGLVWLAWRGGVRRVVVFEYERGLRYVNGRFTGAVPAGRYWCDWRTEIRRVDMRPRMESIPGQEVLSADGVTVKVSLVARYEIVDPAVATNMVADYRLALYLEVQVALREIVGSSDIDTLLAQRGELGARMLAARSEAASALGLRLIAVDVRDIMFPGDLKRVFAQVVIARKEGQAALEKARAETATLRHLANAASLVDRQPTILQLRLLQSVQESSGNTLVLGATGPTLPLRPAPEAPAADS
jgi:regulator of protease activity HflC (stomatin/prohibitin superfamily)